MITRLEEPDLVLQDFGYGVRTRLGLRVADLQKSRLDCEKS